MRGIPFRQEFLPQIASGDKTQTRRLRGLKEINEQPDRHKFLRVNIYGEYGFELDTGNGTSTMKMVKPYYRPGEVVFVQEACYLCLDANQRPRGDVIFKDSRDANLVAKGEWRSPRFMPAWSARLFLKILSAEPQRFSLASMTPQDIEAEGGDPALNYLKDYDGKWLWKYCFEKVES